MFPHPCLPAVTSDLLGSQPPTLHCSGCEVPSLPCRVSNSDAIEHSAYSGGTAPDCNLTRSISYQYLYVKYYDKARGQKFPDIGALICRVILVLFVGLHPYFAGTPTVRAAYRGPLAYTATSRSQAIPTAAAPAASAYPLSSTMLTFDKLTRHVDHTPGC